MLALKARTQAATDAAQEDCVFVKRFRSHKGAVAALAVSPARERCATMCLDGTLKVYDVATFDMIVMLRLKFVPGCMAFLASKRSSQQKLAVSERDSAKVWIFDVASGGEEPLTCLEELHQAPVAAMCANAVHNTVSGQQHFAPAIRTAAREQPCALSLKSL